MSEAAEPPTIVLVEDNDVDRESVRRAFARHRIANPIVDATDGIEALAILRGGPDRAPLRRPYLVLLDLALPRMGGLAFLGELRADPALRDTVVFVFTTSRHHDDLRESYGHQVAGYLVKGDVGAGMIGLADLIRSYVETVHLPAASR